MNWKPLFVAILMFASPVRAEGLPDLGDSSFSDLSPQMERRLGDSVMREIRYREPTYVGDAEIQAYLNDLGSRLAAQAPAPRPDFEFFAMRDPTLNAFALPGGFIGVHTGLILAAQSESELAGVLAHEIAHVTQRHIARMVGQQKTANLATLAAMVVAILAARSNAQVGQAAAAAGQAAGIQSQLNYSRDFEREADRIGMQTLDTAGYDARGMAAFFGRLQQFGRLYENNAPVYLRTHPLTTERISDMDSRAQQKPYRQVPDSLSFQLVRAKLRAQLGTVGEAVTDFQTLVKEKKYSSEIAARYGLAQAQLRAKDYPAANQEVAALRRMAASSPMVENLAAELRMAQGDAAGAAKIYREARQRYPRDRALIYGQVEALLEAGRAPEAQMAAAAELRNFPDDPRLWELQAKSYAAMGKRALQHRSRAEVYVLQGQLPGAIEQLQLALKAGDGDFYENSAVDARLRELRAAQAEEAKNK
jgi:predicted Zn-dependent protease